MKTDPDNIKTVKLKKILRNKIQEKRDNLSDHERLTGSMLIAERFMDLDCYITSKEILAYHTFRSEIDTTIIIREALKHKKKIILPKVSGSYLDLYYIKDLSNDLSPGSFGIVEPIPSKCTLASYKNIDLALIPGVGFDRDYNRLGYGGGFYDKLLKKIPAEVPRIALAFDLQIAESIPVMAHDLKVDIIITEKEMLASINDCEDLINNK